MTYQHPNGGWFAYTDRGVLGPFDTKREAARATEREKE